MTPSINFTLFDAPWADKHEHPSLKKKKKKPIKVYYLQAISAIRLMGSIPTKMVFSLFIEFLLNWCIGIMPSGYKYDRVIPLVAR
ncbi:hypothetical protein HanRHA438_Chr04g0201811 [Helianthus annuus]|nr:hypothetical protein HanRHA438_Chr04g0201811 [Helianthus annuus]